MISIHAPTRGATQGTKIFKTLLYNFNPRSHERSDFILFSLVASDIISIHAPTRGATQVDQRSRCRITERQLFVSGIQCRGDFPVLESGQCSDSFLFVIKNLQCSHLLNPHRRVSDSHSRLCVGECECCFSGL